MARHGKRCFVCQWKICFLILICVFLEASVFVFYATNVLEERWNSVPALGLSLSTKKETKKVSYWDEKNQTYRGVNMTSLKCAVPHDIRFPDCDYKIRYMEAYWDKEPCYHDNGADGSLCSSLYYLSEVEHECPSVEWDEDTTNKLINKKKMKAELCTDIEGLYSLMQDEYRFDWMKMRLKKTWNYWIKAAKELEKHASFKNRTRKRIHVYMGFLKTSQLDFGKEAFKGGPLGELVQWSDLIASLYIMGHDLSVSCDVVETTQVMYDKLLCPVDGKDPDLFFVDINGIQSLEFVGLHHNWPRYKCKIRMLDSFGTEPHFNHPQSDKKDNNWGKLGFDPRQFMTLFPHSPDNSFIGFVVGEQSGPDVKLKKKNIALVYSKVKEYLDVHKGARQFLDYLSMFYKIHGTLYDFDKTKDFEHPKSSDLVVPEYFINHGLLNQTELSKLHDEAKLFIGLGFPYEGPAPLEAISHGSMFIQPKFDPPFNKYNTMFFQLKPNERLITSQNTYCEDFIGKPYVHTVDYRNFEEVRKAVDEILKTDVVDPYLPYEYTHKGMLERVNTYVENMDICSGKQWPPLKALRFRISNQGESCKNTCKRQDLICEPSYFHHINKVNVLQELYKGLSPDLCQSTVKAATFIAPSFHVETRRCDLQTDWLKFSCVDQDKEYQRFCPCREFIRGQVSLCPGCLEDP